MLRISKENRENQARIAEQEIKDSELLKKGLQLRFV